MNGSSFSSENSIERTQAILVTCLGILAFVILSMTGFSKIDRDAQHAAADPISAPAPPVVDIGIAE